MSLQNLNTSFCGYHVIMDLQSERCGWKDKYHMMLHICGILKRVQMNLSTIKSYRSRKQTYRYQGSMLVAQLCLILQKDSSLPGFSVNGTFQTRTLEWVAIPFSRGSSQPRDQTRVSHIAVRFFTV